MEQFRKQNGVRTPDQIISEIHALYEHMNRMGRNDSEHDAIREILDKVNEGSIAPEEALKRTHSILDSKQDYN